MAMGFLSFEKRRRSSRCELEVFRLIGEGLKTSEIADSLHLSVKTVETYRDRIREKLHLKNGTKLAQRAVQWVLSRK
jgi:DNA-binding NarL/FixJ family response regulator